MDPIFKGRKAIRRDDRDEFAEVELRLQPTAWAPGPHGRIGHSSEAERYFNSRFGADFAKRSDDIRRSVAKTAAKAGARRLDERPGIGAHGFVARIERVRVSEGLTSEEAGELLAEAGREAVDRYFEAVDEGRVRLNASDVDRPFEYRPCPGFDEEFIARRRCFLEYVEDQKRPGFLFSYAVSLTTPIEETRAKRSLSPAGVSDFRSAVDGYLCGCRPEADALVERSHELLSLADATDEKPRSDEGGFGLGQRYAALAYIHWLRTGQAHDDALAKARRHYLGYCRRAKYFDRGSANLAAPELLFLGADDVLAAVAKRLSINPKDGATIPRGFFGDALRIVMTNDDDERDRLKAKLRKRLPLHFFRWMHHGQYHNIAFMLHALFPRPEGPPSRLIERVWDFMPEIERRPDADFGWDIAGR